MANDRKIFGRAQIVVNGQFYDAQPGAYIKVGGIKNTSRQFTHGSKYSQSTIPSEVGCGVPITENTSLRQLQELTDAEIHFTSDVGTSYIVRNAVQTGEVQAADGDSGGVAPLVFNGDPAEEVKNG